MIKKLIVSVILLMILNHMALVAQENKNILRIGVGLRMLEGIDIPEYRLSDSNIAVWPTLLNEYQYNFTKYWGLAGTLAISVGKVGVKQDYLRLSTTIGPVFTPFPNKFRWVKLSCGFGGSYSRYMGECNTIDNKYVREEYGAVVAMPSLRIYFLDNKRFELSLAGTMPLDYLPSTNYLYYHYQVSVLFGVKF